MSQASSQDQNEQRHVIRSSPPVFESPLDRIQGFITPARLFFVRNHYPTPDIDIKNWRLKVEGSATTQSVELTYYDLLKMPSRLQVALLECAGNARSFFGKFGGEAAPGVQWGPGGVSLGEWAGVSLADVLSQVGLKSNAVDVLLEGMDEGKVARPIPLEVSMRPSTILAYALNGEPLPPDHGFPLRAIIPGWTGVSNIKWLGRIVVDDKPIETRFNTEEYVFKGRGYPGKPPVTLYSVKSIVALPWNAKLQPGEHMVRGFAWSPHGRVAALEYSLDGGRTWARARLIEPNVPFAWTRWEFLWQAVPGRHTIMTRATDDNGNTQPEKMRPNDLGYLYNAVVPHPVEVAD